jgi:hypothetical protein
MSIIVITPTRGRPAKAAESYEAFLKTRQDPASAMVFVVDKDDPDWDAYVAVKVPVVTYDHEGGGMGPPMNAAAADYAASGEHSIVGFIGDDHRFRSLGWDVAIGRALENGGMAYGNDLARQDIPTAVFISSDIVRALGWFCLPGAKHLYLDNTWAQVGREAGCLMYLPDVIIEHAHPFFGRGQMDEHYARVNHPSMYAHDEKVYREWNMSGQAQRDIETVRGVMTSAKEA